MAVMTSEVLTSDLAVYGHRIGYSGSFEPTLENLSAIVAAHGNRIPFENLNPLMGRPVVDLSRDALFDKLVRHRRGGYCYEHNGLLRYLLSDMGFDVSVCTGRVVYQTPDWESGAQIARTHQVSLVGVPGIEHRYLVDTGFGGQTPTSPVRFVVDEVAQTRHEPYRLLAHGDGYLLEAFVAGAWRPLYVFDETPQQQIDLEVGSWYVSTHPTSTFVTGLSVAMVTDDERWNLRGRNLSVYRNDGSREKVRFDNASQVLDAVVNRFGIDVGGLGDVHARVTAVLDS